MDERIARVKWGTQEVKLERAFQTQSFKKQIHVFMSEKGGKEKHIIINQMKL